MTETTPQSLESSEAPAAELPERRQALWPLGVAVGVYAALSAWMAVASKSFLEADGITHYLDRRFALSNPVHLVSVWSRPLCVAMYAVPARVGGLIGTRLTSLALVLLMLPLLWRVGRRVGIRHPAWACLFLLTQPLLYAHSFSELTEIPFALWVLVMFWAYEGRRFGWLAALAAVAPLGRPEGFGLLLIVGVALVLHRRWVWLLVLPLGLAVWSYAGWRLFGEPAAYPWWEWLPNNWPYSPASVYGHGSIFWLTAVAPAVVGPIGFGFMVLGVWRVCWSGPRALASHERRSPIGMLLADHAYRCRWLVVLIPLSVLAAHSLLWAFGKMASNGEPRYLLIAAPFWAMVSAMGLEWAAERFRWRRVGWVFLLGAAAPIGANLAYPCFPLGPQDHDRLTSEITDWLDTQPQLRQRYPLLVAWLPHLYIRLDIDKDNPQQAGDSSQQGIAHPRPGELAVWDEIYATHNSSEAYCVSPDQLRDAGWRPIARFDAGGHYAYVYVSPQDIQGKAYDAQD